MQAHGVSFGEAATVLEDDFALTREDPDVQGEQRFVTLGMSATGALLVLVYTHREPDVYPEKGDATFPFYSATASGFRLQR